MTSRKDGEKTLYESVFTSVDVGKLPQSFLEIMPSDRLELLLARPVGDFFGTLQSGAMRAPAKLLARNAPEFTILSTAGGLRERDGKTLALGLHTGHFELEKLVRAAARRLKQTGSLPFSLTVSDPCDGRSQGTPGMFDSLPYRNDAAITFRRLARSHPTSKGILGIATCDKGLPAMMMALAGLPDLPAVIVPGGVMLPTRGAKENTASIQSAPARYAVGEISEQHVREEGCRSCGTSGGGCQFLGTAATAQVVAEALGMTVPHSALAPSGQPIWLDMSRKSAEALSELARNKVTTKQILTDGAVHNAMVVYAAFGGSTNLLLHIPAIAHAAGLRMPTRANWEEVNRATPRLVDVLPNCDHPTIRAFMAGGVPEVMLHLAEMDLLNLDCLTVTGKTLRDNLAVWARSARRQILRRRLTELDGVDPDEVICPPDVAKAKGLTGTMTFPDGNLAPEGSVIKSTSIDSSVVDSDGVYRKTGPARVYTSEAAAIDAIKHKAVQPGDIIVLIGSGPLGTGMEETFQLTRALKDMKNGNTIALITDGRFSGVSTGACIGHVGPEALAGGPIGKVMDGDIIRIEIDRTALTGSIDFVGTDRNNPLTQQEGARVLAERRAASELHPALKPHPELPDDTKTWAVLQSGAWQGCVYDSETIVRRMNLGIAAEAALL